MSDAHDDNLPAGPEEPIANPGLPAHTWRPDCVVTGPTEEKWDLAFIAEYPNAAAFLAMVTNPDYREHVKHRQAAVVDCRLIRMKPLQPGEGFGE